VIDPEEGAVRLVMFAAMAGLLLVALCVPEAFGERALTFAVAYGVVRAAHIALFLLASRNDAELRRSVVGLAISTRSGPRCSSLTTLAGVVALLWAMIAYETATYDEGRYRLRHGLEADPPSR
jgi:low temperature requirement protein LtrA